MPRAWYIGRGSAYLISQLNYTDSNLFWVHLTDVYKEDAIQEYRLLICLPYQVTLPGQLSTAVLGMAGKSAQGPGKVTRYVCISAEAQT